MKVPCKDCPEQELRCHSTCIKYKTWKDYLESIRKAKRAESEVDDFVKAQSERRHKYPRRKRKDYGTNKI